MRFDGRSTLTPMTILYLGREAVRETCEQTDIVAAVRSALAMHARGEVVLPAEAYLEWPTERGSARSINMPAYLGAPLHRAGTKIINANPANTTQGLPRASGLIVLFDTETGRPSCIMEAASISALRTAAVSMLCIDHYRPSSRRIALLGAGTLAAAHIELLSQRAKLPTEIALHDRDLTRSAALRQRSEPANRDRNIRIVTTATASEAVFNADVVIPVTTATESYVELEWLRPNALVINISLDDPRPSVVLASTQLVVDDWMLVRSDDRRLLGRMYREGLVTGPEGPDRPGAKRVDGELGHILSREPSDATRRGLVFVNPFGMAIEDVAVAHAVEGHARRTGLGQHLDE